MRFKNRGRITILKFTAILAIAAMGAFAYADLALARAGGGGSDSGSSDSSDRGSDWSSRSNGSSASASGNGIHLTGTPALIANFLFLLMITVGLTVLWKVLSASSRAYLEKVKREKLERQQIMAAAALKDPSWNEAAVAERVNEVFLKFQKAWGEYDLPTMQGLLTDAYYRRMVLELNVLSAMKRKNVMENVRIRNAEIFSIEKADGAEGDGFTTSISASADDALVDTETGQGLTSDSRSFQEYWVFRKEGGAWKLDLIRQTTEAARFVEAPIAKFAERNGFYFDPDFGWIMMPNKGVIFGASRFGRSDINNHVIGEYRNKVVEFYTYRPDPNEKNTPNYVVAQAILPTAYKDIWVRKKTWMDSCPKGFAEMSLEYPDFNKKFTVCAHPEDRVNSLELLTPNFMTKIYDLPFELNIEVVGNFLYFYTKDRDVSYDEMLKVLSWAFDEMKF